LEDLRLRKRAFVLALLCALAIVSNAPARATIRAVQISSTPKTFDTEAAAKKHSHLEHLHADGK